MSFMLFFVLSYFLKKTSTMLKKIMMKKMGDKKMIENEGLVKSFINERNIKESTARTYCCAIRDYEEFHGKSIYELIKEADDEEEKGIRLKRRTLKTRLVDYFTDNLKNSNMSNSTCHKYFRLILTFYKHFEIEVPYMHKIEVKKDYHVTYEDIPKKHHITQALKSCDIGEKALILFMSSSGTAMNETLSLTVEDFINATTEYHSNDFNIVNNLKEMHNYHKDIIPLFKVVRVKNDYPYYTCCSPESSKAIMYYLLEREIINFNDKLFNYSKTTVNRLFKRINDQNDWGKVGFYNFFRSHMLRKFHATEIANKSIVDTLQGRKRDPITETYFKYNPSKIKEEFLSIMDNVRVEVKI